MFIWQNHREFLRQKPKNNGLEKEAFNTKGITTMKKKNQDLRTGLFALIIVIIIIFIEA